MDVFACSSALLRRAAELDLPAEAIGELEALAAQGEVKAIELLRHAGTALGIAVANSIQINNPELVLFADLVGFGNGILIASALPAIESHLLRILWTRYYGFCTISPLYRSAKNEMGTLRCDSHT